MFLHINHFRGVVQILGVHTVCRVLNKLATVPQHIGSAQKLPLLVPKLKQVI